MQCKHIGEKFNLRFLTQRFPQGQGSHSFLPIRSQSTSADWTKLPRITKRRNPNPIRKVACKKLDIDSINGSKNQITWDHEKCRRFVLRRARNCGFPPWKTSFWPPIREKSHGSQRIELKELDSAMMEKRIRRGFLGFFSRMERERERERREEDSKSKNTGSLRALQLPR